ncbi:DUF177 domain-containing protein [Paenibacillus sp. YYML68]|uniref:YceD family protein n=1 Tax=Paenibacillus sp. YYML68 TaxID=2909250 RepID=UPI00248FC461|nr:DUF177 domain-containing protein [Paenibacillus sp. YYML68]
MQLHLKVLALKGSIPLTGHEDLSDVLPKEGSLIGYSPLAVSLEARSVDGAAQVEGQLDIDVELSCSRCLAPVSMHVEVPFHETFVKGEEKTVETDDEEDEDDVLYVTDDLIELKPYLAESVLFSLPYIPLCKEACKGLCPVCGTDRNEKDCGCRQEKIDPRMAGLADFFKKNESE